MFETGHVFQGEFYGCLVCQECGKQVWKLKDGRIGRHQISKKEEPKQMNPDDLSVVKLVHALKDYSPKELEIIARNARGAGITLPEAAELDDVKIAIEALRNKVVKEQNVPEPTYRGITHNKKTVSEMTNAEIVANYDELSKKAIEQGKRKRMEF